MKIRLALLCGAMLFAVSSQAQNSDANIEGRVKKLEKEMVAVQRVAFPNGAGKNIQPELTTAEPVKSTATPSTSAVSDLLVRVDALESSLATLTGQVETQAAQQKALETRIKLLETAMREQAAKTAAAATEPDDEPVKVAAKPETKPPVKTPATTTPAKTTPATGTRAAAVAKVVKPKTADAGEDSYMYGYNLWEAKFYPEAEKQLADTVAKYPNHKRASFARNLQGRAILDDGRPSAAIKVLYDNYKNHADGERAPESLFYLGVALSRIDKNTEACQSFKALADAYPEAVKERLSDRLAEGRAAAKCK